MNIGISGAQCTGKTSLIDALHKSGYNVYTLVARTVMKQHPINKNGNDGTQRAIIDTHLRNLDNSTGVSFMDRCLVDGMVFTLYGARQGKVSAATLADIYKDFYQNINRYDYIVYLEPEFPIISDGVRDEDEDFRQELCQLYELVLSTVPVPIIRPKGTVHERAQTILNATGLFGDR